MQTTWNAVVRTLERGIRIGLVAVFGEGLRQRDPGAVVNGVVALGATSLLDFAESRYDVTFRPWQRVYAGIAMLAHAVGMLGPYDETWWWDHVTHTLSATLLGGVVHAAAERRSRDPRPHVLGAIALSGVVWELLEHSIHAVSRRLGIEPVRSPTAHATRCSTSCSTSSVRSSWSRSVTVSSGTSLGVTTEGAFLRGPTRKRVPLPTNPDYASQSSGFVS